MGMKKRASSLTDGVPIDMTPMIDVVFQLLTFFVMTFKVVEQEGDFNVKMPLAAPRAGLPDDKLLPPFKLRLKASSNGGLAEISLNDKTFSKLNDLRGHISSIIGDERGPGSIQTTAEVEIDADYELQYQNVMAAITAVSGMRGPDGVVTKLVEKIKFAPPRPKRG
jgi:biopolymer transport protein ExbD